MTSLLKPGPDQDPLGIIQVKYQQLSQTDRGILAQDYNIWARDRAEDGHKFPPYIELTEAVRFSHYLAFQYRSAWFETWWQATRSKTPLPSPDVLTQ